MADFDRAIPPGGEGRITLRLDTKAYRGRITKTAEVHTTDPRRKVVTLKLTARVKVPISISPEFVYLYGVADQKVSAAVKIKAELDRPLKLTPAHFDLEDRLKYSIEEVQKGKEFRIHFERLSSLPENWTGSLTLKTNYPEKPEIVLRIRGRFVEIRKR